MVQSQDRSLEAFWEEYRRDCVQTCIVLRCFRLGSRSCTFLSLFADDAALHILRVDMWCITLHTASAGAQPHATLYTPLADQVDRSDVIQNREHGVVRVGATPSSKMPSIVRKANTSRCNSRRV